MSDHNDTNININISDVQFTHYLTGDDTGALFTAIMIGVLNHSLKGEVAQAAGESLLKIRRQMCDQTDTPYPTINGEEITDGVTFLVASLTELLPQMGMSMLTWAVADPDLSSEDMLEMVDEFFDEQGIDVDTDSDDGGFANVTVIPLTIPEDAADN